ncbi:MAG: hypothetical protein V3W34_17050 [Phycisphaerae bacterium]
MPEVLREWSQFLQSGGSLLGLMLAFVGVTFLMSGWRFGRTAIIITYALVGAVGGRMFAVEHLGALAAVASGAAVCVMLCVLLRRYSGPLLAGFLGSMSLWALLGSSTIPPPTVYIVLGLAFAVVGAFSFANIRSTTILLTSFTGAGLFTSGLVGMALDSSVLSPHFQSIASFSFFYPFLVIASMASGIFLQRAAANRVDCGEIWYY